MIRNQYFFVILLLTLSYSLHCDTLFLKNNDFSKCKVTNINKNELSFTVNSKPYNIKLSNVNYLTLENNNRKQNTIKITLTNNKKIQGVLVKAFDTTLIISRKSTTHLKIDLTQIKSILFKNTTEKIKNQIYLKHENNLNDEIKKLLYVYAKKPSLYNNLTVEDDYFYDNYWNIISPYIKGNMKTKIWDMLEIYNKKESSLNDILNIENRSKEIIKIKEQVILLRTEFFIRCRIILLSTV